MTVGSAVESEAGLARIESQHVCPEKVLAFSVKPAITKNVDR